ncbi:MAG: hypothetical protein K9N06_02735 [Candidatus Cloacimonetes bacterium]|nr:hypothetical protein [Candidatus Cloacimonadota bacterium]
MQEKEVNILILWQSIWNNRKLIIITCLIVAVLSAGLSLILPKWYKAQASILPPGSGSGVFGALSSSLSSMGFGSLLGGDTSNSSRLLAIGKSRKMREMINEKFDFETRYKAKYRDDAIKLLGKKLAVTTGREDEINISFYDKDQETVAEVVNFIINKLDSLEIMFSQSKALENRDFIATRVQEVVDSLTALQNNMQTFMEINGIVSIPDQVAAEIEQAARMQAEIAAMEVELQASRNIYDENNLVITQLQEKLRLTNQNYQKFFFSSDSNLFLDLKNIPQYQMQYITMDRQAQYFVTLLEFLGPQYENAKIESFNNVSRIQVLDSPQRPDRRYRPRRAFMVILSTFTAFCVCLFIIYIKSAIQEARQEELTR